MSDFDLGPRPADRLVTSMENHDQIGNRALGERTNHLVALDRYLVGATLALTAPGIPLLFQGEEWAASAPFLFFADHQDAGLVELVRAGRIEEFAAFGWDPDVVPDPEDESTFERSRLDWTEITRADHQRALDHYRTLLDLRRTRPELHDGCFVERVELHPSGRALRFRRGNLVVAANLGAEPVTLSVEGDPDLLVGCGQVHAGLGRLELGPDSALVADVGRTAIGRPRPG